MAQGKGLTRRKPAMAQAVLSELREAILDGQLPPGRHVRQEALADQFGISRIPIREALLTLEREGLVESRGGRGMIVTPLDPSQINDIYELRLALDGYVSATLTARKDFDPSPLRQILEEGQAACARNDFKALVKQDFLFHMGIYEALGNHVIVDAMGAQWTHIRRAIALTLTADTLVKHRFWDAHQSILDSIVSGDAEHARATAVEHIQFARTILL